MTEDLRTSAAVTPPAVLTEEANDGDQKPSIMEEKKTRKRGPFSIFRAALSMMRRSSSKKMKKPIESSVDPDQEVQSSKGENWRKIVGSIRPLHVPDNQTPSISPSTTVDNFEDLLVQQPSSSSSSCGSFPSPSLNDRCSIGSMSQYASATNLQELDDDNDCCDEDDDDPDEVFDALRGDEMIDAKAEEFIAQFYHQMKLQHI